MEKNEEYGYENQPYIAELLKFISEHPVTTPGLHHTIVEHDDWCPLLLGTGPCVCRPVVRSPNRKERRRMKAKGRLVD